VTWRAKHQKEGIGKTFMGYLAGGMGCCKNSGVASAAFSIIWSLAKNPTD
jgi:hypothetical protein